MSRAFEAKLLLDKSWTGQGGLAVLGPEDLSYNDMSKIMTDVLGKPVWFQEIAGEALKAQLIKSGANEIFAQGVVDVRAAKVNGLDNAEPRTAENTTPTSLRQWCEEVMKPAFLSKLFCHGRLPLFGQATTARRSLEPTGGKVPSSNEINLQFTGVFSLSLSLF